MDGKVFTKETKKLIVMAADDAVKLPWYIEPFDGPSISFVLNYIDKQGDKYIPDTVDPLINSAVKLALDGQLEEASTEIGTAINNVVDIPLMDEDTEQEVFVNGIKFILSFIKDWIEKKKNKE